LIAADGRQRTDAEELDGLVDALAEGMVDEPGGSITDRHEVFGGRTSRHAGQCEHVSETVHAVIKVLLKVTDKEDYSWVECGSCAAGWQVAHYAESVG
jgi:hypothetical protein